MTSLGTGCNRNERGGYLSFDLERHLLVKPDLKLKTISVFFFKRRGCKVSPHSNSSNYHICSRTVKGLSS